MSTKRCKCGKDYEVLFFDTGMCPDCLKKCDCGCGHGEEHNPEKCGCKYIGHNMWTCGHIDGL